MQVLSTQGERTNDIARSVQNGDTDILVLWLACRRLVMQTARRWHRAFNGSRGVVLDDLEQVGFLALTKAAETWNPDSGAFSTWLTFQLKTAFAAAYFMRTERDRKDPLNDAVPCHSIPQTRKRSRKSLTSLILWMQSKLLTRQKSRDAAKRKRSLTSPAAATRKCVRCWTVFLVSRYANRDSAR